MTQGQLLLCLNKFIFARTVLLLCQDTTLRKVWYHAAFQPHGIIHIFPEDFSLVEKQNEESGKKLFLKKHISSWSQARCIPSRKREKCNIKRNEFRLGSQEFPTSNPCCHLGFVSFYELDKLFSLFLCFPISVDIFFSTFVFLLVLNITVVSYFELSTVFRPKEKREKRNNKKCHPRFFLFSPPWHCSHPWK